MSSSSIQFHKIWIDQCEATEGIRESFGLKNALDYLIGEKLFNFVQASEQHPEFAAELPAFVAEIRRIFAADEISEYLRHLEQTKFLAPPDVDLEMDDLDEFDELDEEPWPENPVRGAEELPAFQPHPATASSAAIAPPRQPAFHSLPIRYCRHARFLTHFPAEIAGPDFTQAHRKFTVLRAVALFDRPAPAPAIDVLRVGRFFRRAFLSLSSKALQLAVANLRHARLLDPPDPREPETLNCHPLVREYFAEQLRKTDLMAWQDGHNRLYEYYKSVPRSDYPRTLKDILPLYASITHGCRAGRQEEALSDVYQRRIQRGEEFFSTARLGAFSTDLAALANFFDPPWVNVVPALSSDAKTYVMGSVGFDLRALGRLAESVILIKATMDAAQAHGDFWNAARAAVNLTELHLTLGDLSKALVHARESVEFADRSGDPAMQVYNRMTLAESLHQSGGLAEADTLFQEAQQRRNRLKATHPEFSCMQEFGYWELLLDQGKYREVQEAATRTLKRPERQGILLTIALDHLSLGRAYLLEAVRDSANLPLAASHLDQALSGLRKAGARDFIPFGLLSRAAFHRFRRDFGQAHIDLEEAFEIATRSEMRLHEADARIESARLHLAENEQDQARGVLAQARKIVDSTGYHRRDREIADIECEFGDGVTAP